MLVDVYQFCCQDRNYALEKFWQQFFNRNRDPFLSYAAGSILTAELKLFEQNQLAKLGN